MNCKQVFKHFVRHMFLLVGLGNPGKEYTNTRHNIGFAVADSIARQYNFPALKTKFHGKISEGIIEGHTVLLLCPQTYMNRSGISVQEAVRFLQIPLENIIVIHDELDLALGKMRVKIGGGNGGHNGLRDIDARIGKEYYRIRIGIDHPGDRDMVSDYVLHKFSKEEQKTTSAIVTSITENIGLLLEGKKDLFMTRVAVASTEPA